MPETTDFTSGDIATADKPLAPASPAAAPPDTTAKADAGTTVPPVSSEPKKDDFGPIPWERHELILNNTRRDLEGKLNRLSWAERHDPEKVARALAFQERYEAEERTRREAEQAPQPDLQTEGGRPLYSAAQAAKLAQFEAKREAAALREELDRRFGPIETDRADNAKTQGYVNQIQHASQHWPEFDANLPAITATMKAASDQGQPISMHDAYIRVVMPGRDAWLATEKTKWLDELNNTSAVVKDGINPARVPSGSRKADKDRPFRELIGEEMAKASRAS